MTRRTRPRGNTYLWELSLLILSAALLFRSARFDTPFVVLHALAGIALSCASLGAIIARRAGRPSLSGFWLGFLLGPLGILLAGSPLPKTSTDKTTGR